MSAPQTISALPLTADAYQPFGRVIAAADGLPWVPANMATAKRFNRLAEIEDLRPGQARANLCLFRVTPYLARPFVGRMLEKHPFSTQLMVPMGGAGRYLVIVALGGDAPDLASLRAFIAAPGQGVNYRPGVWHHPLIALDRETDFFCLVHEDGTAGDCSAVDLAGPVVVEV